MNQGELEKIARDGKNNLQRVKPAKKSKGFQDTYNEIIDKFWERFKKIRESTFKGSDLDIVNDHCQALTLLTEAHRTAFDLQDLLDSTYTKKKIVQIRKERLEWIIEMKRGLASLAGKLELRVDSSLKKSVSIDDVPELPITMEAPLLLLEEKLHRVQYKDNAELLFRFAPDLKDLHGLILTMQQKQVDEARSLLTFADWIGAALHSAQEKPEWVKMNNGVGRVLLSAFDSAITAAWGALRRTYGVDLSDNFKLLSTSKKLKRCVNFVQATKVVEESKTTTTTTTTTLAEPLSEPEQILTAPPTTSPASHSRVLSTATVTTTEASVIEPISKPEPEVVEKPCECKKHLDVKTGRHYYYHTPTGKSQWLQPPDYRDPPPKKNPHTGVPHHF